MQYLKVDVASTVTIGPAVAVGDGFTPVTGLVGASADEYEIIKHGATTTTGISAALSAITGADGYYSLVLSAAEISDEGRLTLLINDDSLILPIRQEFMVVAANVFDSLFAVAGTDTLQVDQVEIAGTTTPTPTTAGVPDGNVERWLDTLVTLSGALPDVNVEAMDAGSIAAGTIAAAELTNIENEIWDALMSGHQVDGSFGLANNVINAGTASGGGPSTITLDAGEASTNVNRYKGGIIDVVSGTAIGQSRLIISYGGGDLIATVEPAWDANPASGDKYIIRTWGFINLRTATQTSVDAIETDTQSLNDTKVPDTLNTTALGNIGIDWANVENPATALDLAGTDIKLCDTATAVTNDVGITQAGADKVWSTTTRTLTAFSTALALSVWDVLESAIVTASTIGLKLKDSLADVGEPGQGAPPVSASRGVKLDWLFKNFRNKKEQTTGEYRLYDDAGTTVDSKATVSDAAGVTTKEEMASGA